jgi:hypothetical protein
MKPVTRQLIALVSLSLLVACGSPAAPAAPSDAPQREAQPLPPVAPTAAPEQAAWPSELFLVRPAGAKGPALAYDMADGGERFALPAGMLSADGNRYYAVEANQTGSVLRAFDPRTGSLLDEFVVEGQWALSGVSPTGKRLALTRIVGEGEKKVWASTHQWQTDLQIVDAENGEPVHLLSLDGNFEVETVSADGKSLFLVQHLPTVNPDHYLIRLYDLSREALVADPLRSKTSDEVMAGLAWDGIASPNGKWLLTLYLSTRRNVAFVHTLNMVDKFPVCIDLPSGQGDFDQLKHYTLTLSPDGQTVYATNPVLGVVAEVSLNASQVTRTVLFEPGIPSIDYASDAPVGRSVISADGQTLYFTSGYAIWPYATRAGRLSSPYAVEGHVLGLGLSSDGKRLYVARAAQPLLALDAASGQPLSFPAATIASH